MQTTEDLGYWVALSLIPGLGGETYRKLLAAFGAPEQVYGASYASLAGVAGGPVAQAIARGVDSHVLSPTLEWLRGPQNNIVTLADPEYPQNLLQIADPPPFLYVKGCYELLNRPSIAVVGSRNGTPQGVANAQAFSRALSDAGLCVVSGMALGIDAAAHRGGLDGSASSVAVVGTGLDIVYPARNHALAHELAQHGALVSEFPLGTPARAGNFPRRNRIISALAEGCLVVEAAVQSGSLITARLAADQGKEVFAIPGSIHSPLAKGCHALIKQGAKLVEGANDILEELGASFHVSITPESGEQDAPGPVLECMGYDPVGIDTLAGRSGLTSDTVCAMLLELELDGVVASLPGGFYQRVR